MTNDIACQAKRLVEFYAASYRDAASVLSRKLHQFQHGYMMQMKLMNHYQIHRFK